MQVELILDAGATIGEAPTWSADERAIYWIDVKAPALYRLDPLSKAQRTWTLPSDVGAFALTTDPGVAIVALRDGIYRLDLETGQVECLAKAPFDPKLHRFNEGACDSHGRFWVGTMFDPVEPGDHTSSMESLFCYSIGEGLWKTKDLSELHNGMGWSVDENLFYVSHSLTGIIHAYEFDAEAGRLGERGLFAAVEPELGVPDGAAIDAEGGYWCAVHGGGRLRRYLADGSLDQEVQLPVSQPTMCAFGGEALDILYITSAAQNLDAEQRRAQPHAGAILSIRPGITGHPRQNRFNLSDST